MQTVPSNPERPFEAVGSQVNVDYQLPWQSKRLQIVFGLAIFLFVIAIVIRLLTPSTQQTTSSVISNLSNVDGSSSQFNQARFVGEPPTVPQQLPLAAANNQPVPTRSRLIEYFQLQPNQNFPGVWSSQSYSMNWSELNQTFSITLNSLPQSPNTLGFENQTHVTSAQALIGELFPEITLQPIEDEVVFSKMGAHFESVDATEATVAEIPFAQTIEGVPVFLNNQFRHPITVVISNQNELIELRVQQPLISFSEIGRATTLSVPQAVSQLTNTNAGLIIVAEPTNSFEINLTNIVTSTFTEASLEYRFNANSGQVTPFYKLTGSVVNTNQEELLVEVITPAVALRDL